jgi:hypothetical protein
VQTYVADQRWEARGGEVALGVRKEKKELWYVSVKVGIVVNILDMVGCDGI